MNIQKDKHTNIRPNKGREKQGGFMKKTILMVAMILVAIIAIGAVAAVMLNATADIAPTISGNVNVVSTVQPEEVGPKTETVEVPMEVEPETRVLLVDASGSMDNTIYAFTGYDCVIPFSDYLSESSGDTRIGSCLSLVLDMGIRELGLVSDLEVYPRNDLQALETKFYSSRELLVYVPENVEQERYQLCRDTFAGMLDEKTSTLIFVFPSGTTDVVFDNYVKPEDKTIKKEVEVYPELVTQDEVIYDDRVLEGGNYVPPSQVRNIWITFILVTALLIEVILALLMFIGRNTEKTKEPVKGTPQDVPEWVTRAVATGTIALDGSGSVKNSYSEFLSYLSKLSNINQVWRFAGDVEKLDVTTAKGREPEGRTHGWKCLSDIFQSGAKEVTLLSDLEFTDDEIQGLCFEKIVFVLPNVYDQKMLVKLKGICNNNEVINL